MQYFNFFNTQKSILRQPYDKRAVLIDAQTTAQRIGVIVDVQPRRDPDVCVPEVFAHRVYVVRALI